jgi:hypothetical protein
MLFKSGKGGPTRGTAKRRVLDSVLATMGYILSPLSWWNDMVVNVPLSYVFSYPFSLIDERLFLPAFVLGYWLSNLLGFLLLHRGAAGLLGRHKPSMSVWKSLLVALAYTIIIVLLVWFKWIPVPTDLVIKR